MSVALILIMNDGRVWKSYNLEKGAAGEMGQKSARYCGPVPAITEWQRQKGFVVNSFWYWKPVQGFEKKRSIVISRRLKKSDWLHYFQFL